MFRKKISQRAQDEKNNIYKEKGEKVKGKKAERHRRNSRMREQKLAMLRVKCK